MKYNYWDFTGSCISEISANSADNPFKYAFESGLGEEPHVDRRAFRAAIYCCVDAPPDSFLKMPTHDERFRVVILLVKGNIVVTMASKKGALL